MSDHRAQRLKERYGLTLTRPEIDALDALIAPENRVRTKEDAAIHVIRYGEFGLIAVVARLHNGKIGICTFLDPDTFVAGRRRQQVIQTTGKAGKTVGWRRTMQLQRRMGRRETEA